MAFHFIKKILLINKSTIVIIIYVLGLIYAALVLELWSAETGPMALVAIIWTTILLIALFYTNKNDLQ